MIYKKATYRRIAIFILLTTLGGCRTPYMKPPINRPSDDASIKLAEAASSLSDSMLEIARIEKVIIPQNKDNTLTIPDAYELQTRASVDWSGPIREVTAQIAKSAHFRLRILGKEPSIPILISLSLRDESLAEILRDIDYQAGKKASIYVYPKSRVVELRYAKVYA